MSARMILMAVVLAACGGAEGASLGGHPLVTSLGVGDSLGALERPAAFAGALPCAGCDGIDATLVLLPDGSYRLQERRRTDRERDTLVAVGRWLVRSDSSSTLVLLGDAGTRSFTIVSDLRLADPSTPTSDDDTRTAVELVRVSAPRALNGPLRVHGEFRDLVDAPTFVTCSGGRQYPLAGDSAFVRLQRAHRDHSLGTGAATRVELLGRLEMRGPVPGTSLETVVVDSFVVADAGCQVTRTHATISIGDWVLTALDGAALSEPAVAHRPSLRFVLSAEQMFGNAGCNRFTGRAVLRGLDLVGQPLAMTRRACADSTVMAREARYGEILSEGGWFRLDGADLVLAKGGTEVARFRRR